MGEGTRPVPIEDAGPDSRTIASRSRRHQRNRSEIGSTREASVRAERYLGIFPGLG